MLDWWKSPEASPKSLCWGASGCQFPHGQTQLAPMLMEALRTAREFFCSSPLATVEAFSGLGDAEKVAWEVIDSLMASIERRAC